MKMLLISFIMILSLVTYSTEKELAVPASGTLMKYTTKDTLKIKPVSATGTMFVYFNNLY
ncbi:hypothetical protein NON08_13705 [Cetobacterium somerae]|uniref:hypothetical protein n=1 Tax=Cetobacterium sp. NK01 TaxID=2993530 RepID=UPI002115FEFE|nr:hypothetical protein [Cetobacterium sp. NK01]MCQ8213557.1 hypothetical protein [Cetobacterium sp. NK01]